MEKRRLGRSDLHMAPLMIGANVFGWTADEAAAHRILDAFVDAGIDGIDTADTYSRWVPGNRGGDSEAIIGSWLKKSGKRNKVVVATKLGMDMGEGKIGLSRKYMMNAVEDSLRNLGVETIDLYQAHRDDEATPQEETMSAFADLVKQGKVRALGCSMFPIARLKSAQEISAKNGWPRYETVQNKYNLYEREDYEGATQDYCVANGLSAINYSGLANGFLTGKYRSSADFGKSARGPRMEAYMNPKGMRILAALDEAGAQLKATPAQVALAWVMAKPGVAAPIASATSVEQVNDLVKAVNLNLPPATLAALDQAGAPG